MRRPNRDDVYTVFVIVLFLASYIWASNNDAQAEREEADKWLEFTGKGGN